jgi:hypothetical protein
MFLMMMNNQKHYDIRLPAFIGFIHEICSGFSNTVSCQRFHLRPYKVD